MEKHFEKEFTKKQTSGTDFATNIAYEPSETGNIITGSEVGNALKKMKNNKSGGCDNIKAELLKYGDPVLHGEIAKIINNTLNNGTCPKEIRLGILIPLQKPGKTRGPPENCRPIIIMSVLRKIIAIILVDRTIKKISKMIPPSQAAYRHGRGTTEQVFALKTLIDIARNSKEYKIYILLMDMTKAFDRIDRSTLLEDLKEILEPQELKMFQILLTDTEIRIKIKNMFGKTIKTNIGSPQGDSASAILFILYLALRLKKYRIDVRG